MENKATFFDLTKPASNIANPAAIHITKKLPIRKRKVFRMKTAWPDTKSEFISSAHKALAVRPQAIIVVANIFNEFTI